MLQDQRIKVLHLFPTLDAGGTEGCAYKLVTRSNPECFEHLVVSLTDIGSMGRRMIEHNIPVIALGLSKRYPNPALGLWKLLHLLHQEKPHILEGWLYYGNLMGLIVGRIMCVPVLLWNIQNTYDNDKNRFTYKLRFVSQMLSYLSQIPDAIIVDSNECCVIHTKSGYHPRIWKLIMNGFDTDLFKPNPKSRLYLRQMLGLEPETLIIGMVARYHPPKDHKNFIKAAKYIVEVRKDIHFVLIGPRVNNSNRELTEIIRSEGAEQHIHLLGERSESDLTRIVPGFDISTLSSSRESSPNVVGEAMACGVPCVVTNVGNAAYLVDNTGITVPPRDPKKLARAWSAMIALGAEGRQRLGQAARRRIEENFSLDIMISHRETLYRTMVEKFNHQKLIN